jgi:hypothetical protein
MSWPSLDMLSARMRLMAQRSKPAAKAGYQPIVDEQEKGSGCCFWKKAKPKPAAAPKESEEKSKKSRFSLCGSAQD